MSDTGLTRYRRCEKSDGERLIPNHETNLIERCKCREGFLPDDTLRQIANAYQRWKDDTDLAMADEVIPLLDGLVNDE